jgi:AraC-like DNA-binding protein
VRPAESVPDAAALWDIATPSQLRVPGLQMAGFRQRGTEPVDLEIVPFAAITLAVDLGDAPITAEDGGGQRCGGTLVAGLAPDHLRVRGRAVEALQVRLSPVLAHAVLGAAGDLGGTVVDLEALWGRDAVRLREQLRDAGSWEARFALAEEALVRRLERGRGVDPEVAFAWREVTATHGQVRVDELAADVGWSRKRLWARFRSQVGLTPKRAAQLVRFDHAAHRLAAGERAATVAAEAGYADQPHLHRDVKAFTGLTPTAVAAAPWLAVDDVAWATPPHG